MDPCRAACLHHDRFSLRRAMTKEEQILENQDRLARRLDDIEVLLRDFVSLFVEEDASGGVADNGDSPKLGEYLEERHRETVARVKKAKGMD